MSVSVGWPLALWALLVVPVIVALVFRSRFALSARRRWMAAGVRAVVVALVVLAVADVRVTWDTEELAVAAIVDPSVTIAPEERAAVTADLQRMSEAHPEVAMRLVGARHQGSPRDVSTELSTAIATLPRDRVLRVLLATDGRDPAGDLPAAIA